MGDKGESRAEGSAGRGFRDADAPAPPLHGQSHEHAHELAHGHEQAPGHGHGPAVGIDVLGESTRGLRRVGAGFALVGLALIGSGLWLFAKALQARHEQGDTAASRLERSHAAEQEVRERLVERVRAEPGSASARLALASFLVDVAREDDEAAQALALESAQRAVEMAPLDGEARVVLARAWTVRGNRPQALAELAAASELAPQSATVAEAYARALRDSNRPALARAELERLCAVRPERWQSHAELARLCFQLGDRAAGEAALARARALAPSEARLDEPGAGDP